MDAIPTSGEVHQKARPVKQTFQQAIVRNPNNCEVEVHMPKKTHDHIEIILEFFEREDFSAAGSWLDIFHTEECLGCSLEDFYQCLTDACVKVGDVRSVSWCTVRMIHVGLTPNQVAFNSLIEAACEAGDVEGAMFWWNEMMKHGVEPNNMTCNMMSYQHVLTAEKWLKMALKDTRIKPDIIAFSTIIDGFARVGDLNKAAEWFSKLHATGLKADVVMYNILINASGKFDDVHGAEKWFASMVDAGVAPDERSFNYMTIAMANSGALEKAEMWFSHMVLAGFEPHQTTYDAIVHASAENGDTARVAHWTEEMRVFGHNPTVPMPSRDDVRRKPLRRREAADDLSVCLRQTRSPGRDQPSVLAFPPVGAPPGLAPPIWVACGQAIR